MAHYLRINYIDPSGHKYSAQKRLHSSERAKRFGMAHKYLNQLERLGFIVVDFKVIEK